MAENSSLLGAFAIASVILEVTRAYEEADRYRVYTYTSICPHV